ncbi:MAG: hypothetical protein ABIS23_07250 [Sphingomicrobium sp.]
MKHFRLPAFAFAAAALLAACESRDPVADEANATGPANVTNDSSGAIAGGPPGPTANGSSDLPAGPIPAAIHGRWSLTPADCTSTRGDAKGLLEINADSLKFYESRAVPTTSIEAGGQGISGNFDFTGEGQNWSKYVSLKIQGDGLVRTERNPLASYTYVRCE